MVLTMIQACLAIVMLLPFPQRSPGWRGIVPLRSTRAEVERVLGARNEICDCYSTNAENVRVEYSSGPCKGDLAGWNIPANTVLSVEVYPKDARPFSELKVSKEAFVKTVDDASFSHYGNGETGLRYSVSWEGMLHSIWYGPTVRDNHLRCAGFPPTDGGITTYRPYYEFPYKTVEDVETRVGDFGIRLLREREFKGYVLIYSAPGTKTETIAKSMTAVKNYLTGELNVDSRALEVINGGFRESPAVALFLIPRDWPPPVATPTLGGWSDR